MTRTEPVDRFSFIDKHRPKPTVHAVLSEELWKAWHRKATRNRARKSIVRRRLELLMFIRRRHRITGEKVRTSQVLRWRPSYARSVLKRDFAMLTQLGLVERTRVVRKLYRWAFGKWAPVTYYYVPAGVACPLKRSSSAALPSEV